MATKEGDILSFGLYMRHNEQGDKTPVTMIIGTSKDLLVDKSNDEVWLIQSMVLSIKRYKAPPKMYGWRAEDIITASIVPADLEEIKTELRQVT